MTAILFAALLGVLAACFGGVFSKVCLSAAVLLLSLISLVVDHDDGSIPELLGVILVYNLAFLCASVVVAVRRRGRAQADTGSLKTGAK